VNWIDVEFVLIALAAMLIRMLRRPPNPQKEASMIARMGTIASSAANCDRGRRRDPP
jgi:hypothetical protein